MSGILFFIYVYIIYWWLSSYHLISEQSIISNHTSFTVPSYIYGCMYVFWLIKLVYPSIFIYYLSHNSSWRPCCVNVLKTIMIIPFSKLDIHFDPILPIIEWTIERIIKLQGIFELQPRRVSWSDNILASLLGRGDWSSTSLGHDIDPTLMIDKD